MSTLRHTEVNVLGYRIDRVSQRYVPDQTAASAHSPASWREVLCPKSGSVLARFTSRAEAERFIIERELASARRALQRSAA